MIVTTQPLSQFVATLPENFDRSQTHPPPFIPLESTTDSRSESPRALNPFEALRSLLISGSLSDVAFRVFFFSPRGSAPSTPVWHPCQSFSSQQHVAAVRPHHRLFGLTEFHVGMSSLYSHSSFFLHVSSMGEPLLGSKSLGPSRSRQKKKSIGEQRAWNTPLMPV